MCRFHPVDRVAQWNRGLRPVTLPNGLVGVLVLVKQVDRYVENQRVESEQAHAPRVVLALSRRWLSPLVIAVDWSAASPGGSFVELCASVVWLGMGSGLTVYQRAYPASKTSNRKAEDALLKVLADWILTSTRVNVVTDAGFRARAPGAGTFVGHARSARGGGRRAVRPMHADRRELPRH